ncbi:hypothetical protein BpHYR1_032722 [Brachionus plicatilis]|uniref:Uncharacterized protein n=1 Tax=Brachionus plicatilis TaxID=10195 RepID=A0A3M7SJU5_BRAPC|nr:hypothetical protein BpHYR1_032722 [Brachionus plicatilis]
MCSGSPFVLQNVHIICLLGFFCKMRALFVAYLTKSNSISSDEELLDEDIVESAKELGDTEQELCPLVIIELANSCKPETKKILLLVLLILVYSISEFISSNNTEQFTKAYFLVQEIQCFVSVEMNALAELDFFDSKIYFLINWIQLIKPFLDDINH